MNFLRSKRAQVGAATAGIAGLVSVVILLVVLGMTTTFGSDIIQDTQDDVTADSQAYNNSKDANEAIGVIADKSPTVSRVTIGAFIILILIAAFGGFIGRGGIGR